MRKFLMFAFCLFTISMAQAQYKGSVPKAEAAIAKGDFTTAKGEIEQAILDEKNSAKSRTWFIRGNLYAALATSDDPAVSGLAPDALDLAVESYKKALAMDKDGSPSFFFTQTAIDDLWGKYINKGGEAYGEDAYGKAYELFMLADKVKPNDSLTTFYAAAAAQNDGNYRNAADRYYTLVANGQVSPDIYQTLIYIERAELKNDEKALEVVRAAKLKYPGNDVFSKEEINILIAMEKVDEAREKIEKEIETDPNNIALHLNLGILYDNLGAAHLADKKYDECRPAYEKAMAAYGNALKLEETNFVALYNTGAVYVNLGKIYLDQARDMDLKTYQKEGPKLTEKAHAELKKGLPFLEKASAASPQDTDALRALYQVYQQLKMNDKANEAYEKLTAIEGEGDN